MNRVYTVPTLDDYSPAALDKAVADLLAALESEAAALRSEGDWKAFRDRWLARKNGILTQVNDTWLKAAPKEAKREVGQRVNEIRKEVEKAVDAAQITVKFVALSLEDQRSALTGMRSELALLMREQLARERLDITLPGVQRPIGVKHPVLRAQDEIVAVFKA